MCRLTSHPRVCRWLACLSLRGYDWRLRLLLACLCAVFLLELIRLVVW